MFEISLHGLAVLVRLEMGRRNSTSRATTLHICTIARFGDTLVIRLDTAHIRPTSLILPGLRSMSYPSVQPMFGSHGFTTPKEGYCSDTTSRISAFAHHQHRQGSTASDLNIPTTSFFPYRSNPRHSIAFTSHPRRSNHSFPLLTQQGTSVSSRNNQNLTLPNQKKKNFFFLPLKIVRGRPSR